MIVAITFSDHVEGGSTAFKFTVYGRLASVTRTTLAVDSWAYVNGKKKHDHNQTRFTIVRSAIHRLVRLKEDEVIYDEKIEAKNGP
jgi:hypothetical protein